MSGNDAEAKRQVSAILVDWFGWKKEKIIDLGDISTARGVEMVLPLWVNLFGILQTPNFNFRIVVGP